MASISLAKVIVNILSISHEIFKDGIEVVRHLLDLGLLHHKVLLHLKANTCDSMLNVTIVTITTTLSILTLSLPMSISAFSLLVSAITSFVISSCSTWF